MFDIDTLTEYDLLELELLERERDKSGRNIPTDWRKRLRALYPAYFWHEFSPPHVEFWEWANEPTPEPFIAIWPRGRGKSTNAEVFAADVGIRDLQSYCLYVSGTQDQADKHVGTIRNILESTAVQEYAPQIGRPKIGKNGSQTWRRSIVTTDTDYTVEAIGLNKAVRGQKIDWARPGLIIFDDVDERHDTETAVKKKREIITSSILPSAAQDAIILFAQNLIHTGSIATELSKRPGEPDAASYMVRRRVSGPHPAVSPDLEYEMIFDDNGVGQWVVTKGKSLWHGFDLEVVNSELSLYGPTSFEMESQHNIDMDDPGALLSTEILDRTRVSSHPDLIRVVVGVDPSGGAGGVGIIAGGKARVGRVMHGYTIADYTTPHGTKSNDWAKEVLRCYHSVMADAVVVEKNFGGDMVKNTIKTAELYDDGGMLIIRGVNVPVIEVNASRGKAVRAEPVSSLFQEGKAHHVGHYPALEKQWTQWIPGTKPSPDRLDAEVWVYTQLGLLNQGIEVHHYA